MYERRSHAEADVHDKEKAVHREDEKMGKRTGGVADPG
jgi:hypothetical protein